MSYKDLATVHELITELFHWPQTPEEWEQYKLSDEQVNFFKENGFLANVKMIDEKQIALIKSEIEQLADTKLSPHRKYPSKKILLNKAL